MWWAEDVPGGTEEVPENTFKFTESQRKHGLGSSSLTGEVAGGWLEKGHGRTHFSFSQARESERHSLCQTVRRTDSALTFSFTAAALWLWHHRQVHCLNF